MNDIKVTVYIPVYNGGDFLEPCLNSVVTQTLKDIEIILVDDGSTDGSAAICDKFKEKDSRITVIHQENKGGNYGFMTAIGLARGEYFYSMDDDDILPVNALEKLYSKSDGCDVVKGNAAYFTDNKIDDNLYLLSLHKEQYISKDISNPQDIYFLFDGIPETWTYLLRIDWMKYYKVYPGNHLYYDIDLAFKIKIYARTIKLISNIIYLWRINPNSLSHKKIDYNIPIKPFEDLEVLLKREKLNNYWGVLSKEYWRIYSWLYNTIEEDKKEEFFKIMQRDFRRLYWDQNIIDFNTMENVEGIINAENIY